MPRRTAGALMLGLALALTAGSAQAVPPKQEAVGLPSLPDDPDPATGKDAAKASRPADPAKKAAATRLDPVVWPTAGSAEVTVSAAAPLTAGRAAGGTAARTPRPGGIPVSVSPARGSAPAAAGAAPSKVRISSLGHGAARKWGSAALLTVRRTDGAATPGPVELSLSYAAFADGAGGAYGSRLRLMELPACAAVASPSDPTCKAVPKPIRFENNSAQKTLTARVSASPAEAGDGGAVYAVAAGNASAKGDYKATSLAPSASWSVSASSGGFSWDYPIRTIPTPGGFTPTVGFGYSSQSADGRTAATNNQGSWIGEGFSYEPGYIERSYKPCSEDGQKTSAEQCWAFDNATIMLNGMSGELIQDDKSKKWRLSSDNGAKIEKLDSTLKYPVDNGDNNGEHWKLTTTDGTEYYFGRNKLPGWTAKKEETSSTWTVPVFGNDPEDPCYNATFTKAHCKQAWRWNLDYVKDLHGNVMAYYYGAEKNRYALNAKTDVNGTEYDRGGYLKRIDYGQQDGSVYSSKAPARISFDVAERCIPDEKFDCAESKFTAANASHWPDTPVDQYCKADTKCAATQSSQTFFTTKRLTGVRTQMSTGPGAADYKDVDAWKLTHFFTDNGDQTKTLWLSKIDHEGRADHLGQGGAPAKLPSVVLQGVHLKNRVDSTTDNKDAIHRYRLATVLSETGAQLDIKYAEPDCTASALPTPGASVKRCFPVVWAPPGSIEPRTDWFHKYVVEEVLETDRTGGGEDRKTQYSYKGNAGWRHAEPDGMTDAKFLTWGQWQGYGKVSVTSGNPQAMKSRIDYTYLQGLDGDQAPGGGSRTEKIKDSTGVEYTGHKEFTGFEIEAATYDKGKVVSKVIDEPWKFDTATQTRTWLTSHATVVKTKSTRGYTALPGGTWRTTKSVSEYDTGTPNVRLDRTDDFGDLATGDDDTCTRLWYADNETLHLYELPSRSEAVTVGCSATPDRKSDVLADERTLYDNKAFGAAPVRGLPTSTQRLTSHNGTTGTYQVTGTTEYDRFGRPTAQQDAKKSGTTTKYTDVNGLISQTTVTNAENQVTTTDYAPAWGASTGQTDPNGKRTDLAYDALGRLTSVWLADRPKTKTPSIKYSYLVRQDDTVVVKTEKIDNDGGYGAEYQFYDSLLRPRQLQTEGQDGTRMIGDVFYDGSGNVRKTNATYNAAGAPTDKLQTVADGEVGGQTLYEYDGLGRATTQIFQVAGIEQWRTTTVYEGDRTHVDPPTGQSPTTTITDAAGRVVELRKYHGPSPVPSGPGDQYDSTTYSYTKGGLLETVTDAKKNTWRYEYNQLGLRTKSVDPDAGTTETTYDELDRPVTTTVNSVNKTSTVYDKLSRPVTTWSGEPETGTKLTETKYDKPGWVGYAWASYRYVDGGESYASVTQDMDAMYRPKKTAYTVPASEGALAGTYTFTTTYNPDGTVKGQGMPAAGALTGEAIAYTYDKMQRPVSMTGKTSYVTRTQYGPTSLLKALHLSTGQGKAIQHSFEYERGTDRMTNSTLRVVDSAGAAQSSNYSYDEAGNVLAITDTAGPTPDVQCFAYDGGQRLTDAWTPAATAAEAAGSGTKGSDLTNGTPTACEAAPGAKSLGGPAPYRKSYETDSIGNRTMDVTYDVGGDASKNVARHFTYGENGAGPHAVTTVVENTPTGDKKSTYGYDAAGNTTTRTIGGDEQRLDWDASGDLTRTTEANGDETGYVYGADGSRVLRRDAKATTVYLPGMELRLAKGATAAEATRYYSYAGQTIAVRQNDNTLTFLSADHHGSAELAIDSTTQAVTQRRFDPYGVSRSEPTGEWPGEKGFVGGTVDEQTGLTHLGAREYDPGLGKFISVDPVIDYTDPQQMNAYAYASNSPVTLSDPSGLLPCAPGVSERGNSCGGCTLFCSGEAGDAQAKVEKATGDRNAARAQQGQAKQRIKQTAKALVKIVRDLIGVDAALDCFSSGDLGSCGETLLNVAGSFAGGLAGKILAKYGLPWKWAKGVKLAKRVVGLVSDLIGGVKDLMKSSKALSKAEDALAVARAKAKAALSKLKRSEPTACHSFLPGTRVLLADGSTKPIEKVKLGDKVVVTDPATGRTSMREAVGTIVTEDDKSFVDLTITPKKGAPAKLVATTTHPFWVVSENTWLDAGDLRPGMELRTATGDIAMVKATHPFDQRQRTHDLTISGVHAYYVLAGATPVLVHNCGGQVEYGGNELSQAVMQERLKTGNKANNFAAVRYADADGVSQIAVAVSSKGLGNHAERKLLSEYGDSITEAYSEFQPCTGTNKCRSRLAEAGIPTTWTWGWTTSAEGAAARSAKGKAVTSMFRDAISGNW
ncbi:RHS repeat-associated core domain-containing protein [Streptomyces sp. NPDC059118]|uniref:RHS repeat-associated core domain-containing protein n=2 Tax=unclassified Streptomyces TaxID=2593676 RepID=UPI0036AB059B